VTKARSESRSPGTSLPSLGSSSAGGSTARSSSGPQAGSTSKPAGPTPPKAGQPNVETRARDGWIETENLRNSLPLFLLGGGFFGVAGLTRLFGMALASYGRFPLWLPFVMFGGIASAGAFVFLLFADDWDSPRTAAPSVSADEVKVPQAVLQRLRSQLTELERENARLRTTWATTPVHPLPPRLEPESPTLPIAVAVGVAAAAEETTPATAVQPTAPSAPVSEIIPTLAHPTGVDTVPPAGVTTEAPAEAAAQVIAPEPRMPSSPGETAPAAPEVADGPSPIAPEEPASLPAQVPSVDERQPGEPSTTMAADPAAGLAALVEEHIPPSPGPTATALSERSWPSEPPLPSAAPPPSETPMPSAVIGPEEPAITIPSQPKVDATLPEDAAEGSAVDQQGAVPTLEPSLPAPRPDPSAVPSTEETAPSASSLTDREVPTPADAPTVDGTAADWPPASPPVTPESAIAPEVTPAVPASPTAEAPLAEPEARAPAPPEDTASIAVDSAPVQSPPPQELSNPDFSEVPPRAEAHGPTESPALEAATEVELAPTVSPSRPIPAEVASPVSETIPTSIQPPQATETTLPPEGIVAPAAVPPAINPPEPRYCASCGTQVTVDPGSHRCAQCGRPLCEACRARSIRLGNGGKCPTCSFLWRIPRA
jgi:hypothetical protein